MSAILIESKKDFTLRFLRCFFEEDKVNKGDQVLKLVQLGLMVTKPSGEKSRLEKYKYSNGKTEEGKGYMVGTVLRANGRIEFYSDFMLVEEHFDQDRPCVDIETDAELFYYKFLEQCKDERGNKTGEF